jgi:hypothetical protein
MNHHRQLAPLALPLAAVDPPARLLANSTW